MNDCVKEERDAEERLRTALEEGVNKGFGENDRAMGMTVEDFVKLIGSGQPA
jgi:hypothetical protein